MKQKIRYVKIGFENFFGRHDFIIIFGLLMAVGTLIKLLGYADYSSDWFWFLAGLGLFVEGLVASAKQRKFDGKYKILTQKEYENMLRKE